MQPIRKVTLNFRDHRPDSTAFAWDLPQWGHPASMMVMPLFVSVAERLIPVGSAFAAGRGLGFTMSAFHNIMEAVTREPRFDRQRTRGALPTSMTLSDVGLSVLHQTLNDEGILTFNFLPLANVEGAPPTDVVIGHARLPEGTPSLSLPLSFAFPTSGEIVWSVGYAGFVYPDGGIPIRDVREGKFDWRNDYSHRFCVVEAEVEASFTCCFTRGFVDGPSFAINRNIEHGMSGGPVISESGHLIGLNSAGAENFFGRPMAVASMLHPLLLTPVTFGASLGPVTMKARRPFFELIGQGIIGTDGSEQNIGFSDQGGDQWAIHATAPIDTIGLFDDFAGYQSNAPATTVDEIMYHLVRHVPEDKEGTQVV